MRHLEIRRHALTKKGSARGRGSHLSPEGIAAARAVGDQLGAVAFVAASEAPRTLETAIAMGFAVDDICPFGASYVGVIAHHEQWSWQVPYRRYFELLQKDRRVAAAAAQELRLWRVVLEHLPDGAKALVVSHGGVIEPTLVAALPTADHDNWGAPFSHLDGVELVYDGDRCVDLEFRRYESAGSFTAADE